MTGLVVVAALGVVSVTVLGLAVLGVCVQALGVLKELAAARPAPKALVDGTGPRDQMGLRLH